MRKRFFPSLLCGLNRPGLGQSLVILGLLATSGHAALGAPAVPAWRDVSNRATLRNNALEAVFQSGILVSLKDRATGEVLMDTPVDTLPAQRVVFDETPLDLDSSRVSQKANASSIQTRFTAANGDAWETRWSIQPGKGDLILQMKGRPTHSVEEMRAVLANCDISAHRAVLVDNFGVARPVQAPWNGNLLGDPEKDGTPMTYVQPIVTLFEGKKAGWFVEGRDEKIGPSNVLLKGNGQTATVGFVRRFPIATAAPELYEIHLRSYSGRWENAVDPYVSWMEKGAGFVPLDKKNPAWIKDIKTLSFVDVGDYAQLEELAKRVDPRKTLISRLISYRRYGVDIGYPDYRLKDGAKEWFQRAHQLGFHVAAWFNSKSVSALFPELVERFKPGMQVTGKDAQGNDTYEHIYEGRDAMYRISGGYKPWRDYFIAQMKDVVDAGVDVIYLDESMSANGKFVVDGVDGDQGMMTLMQQIQQTYPGVAVQTEQVNSLTAKHAAFALSQMPLGHPLSGYIFRRYVKVVPEGVMYSPADNEMMDAFASWGYMLPGANPIYRDSDVEIVQAFQKYDLVPDSTLPHHTFAKYQAHYSQGLFPTDDAPLPPEGLKLFGYRGRNGVTAFFEKRPHERGLVVYEPSKAPQWFGARYSGLSSYDGPGLPVYFYFRHTVRDWLIYDGNKLLGLNPAETYWFDKTLKPSPARFHVTRIPADFAGVIDSDKRVPPQEIGQDDAFFQLVFTGNGEMGLYVPDGYDAYLDGEKVAVDPATHFGTVQVSTSNGGTAAVRTGTGPVIGNTTMELSPTAAHPSMLTVVKRLDAELSGNWTKLPWKPTLDSLTQVTPSGDDFDTVVGGIGRVNGRLPNAKSIRLQGSYQMVDDGPGPPGDGVVRINGREVLRAPHGEHPYPKRDFDVDISQYAGQYVLFEFWSDGWPGRSSSAKWLNPRIVVGN